MSAFTQIDLSTLPSPSDIAVENISFEDILAAMLADLRQRDPAFTATVESDPAYKILEVAAYREVLIRQRVNDGCKAVMLAYSQGADLEQLGAFYGVARNVIDEGDPNAFPPRSKVMESDASYRRRVQLALEGFSTAGPEGAYIFHALSVPHVKDVAVLGPNDSEAIEPGEVKVYVVGIEPGAVLPEVVAAVAARLNKDDVRPLTDQVEVIGAERVVYNISANVHTLQGPDPSVVIENVRDAVATLAESSRVPGRDIPLSAIYAALHQAGVSRVNLISPLADIVIEPHQVGEIGATIINDGGIGE